ncbi:MAG: hypothetical protein ACYDBK_00770 [Thermoplasmataceae archaeon]
MDSNIVNLNKTIGDFIVGFCSFECASREAAILPLRNFLLRRQWSALFAELELYYRFSLVLIHNILISFSHHTFSHSFSRKFHSSNTKYELEGIP